MSCGNTIHSHFPINASSEVIAVHLMHRRWPLSPSVSLSSLFNAKLSFSPLGLRHAPFNSNPQPSEVRQMSLAPSSVTIVAHGSLLLVSGWNLEEWLGQQGAWVVKRGGRLDFLCIHPCHWGFSKIRLELELTMIPPQFIKWGEKEETKSV